MTTANRPRADSDANAQWTEKYRPASFKEVVLAPITRKFFERIIEERKVPNILLHGPPGSGKTTAIMNLKSAIYSKNDYRELVIHLNASDDRGIDVIRKQISLFVNSKNIFHQGCKIVILDESDYMTTSAQKELISIIEESSDSNISFILMCNYLTKLDSQLVGYFIRIPFVLMDDADAVTTIRRICSQEQIPCTDVQATALFKHYNGDLRCVVNHLQTKAGVHIISAADMREVNDILSTRHHTVDRIVDDIFEFSADRDMTPTDLIQHHMSFLKNTNMSAFRTLIIPMRHILHVTTVTPHATLVGYYISYVRKLSML